MEKNGLEAPKPPVGFLKSIWQGIEIVNSFPGLLIVPVALDLFLWFGPRLSISNLLAPVFKYLQQWMTTTAGSPVDLSIPQKAFASFNLSSLLSIVPFFPPSLLSGFLIPRSISGTPLGPPMVWQIPNALAAIGVLVGLILLSVVLGATYWVMAGQAVEKRSWGLREIAERWLRVVGVALFLGLVLTILLMILFYIGLFLSAFVGVIWPAGISGVFSFVSFLIGGIFFWLILFLCFSVHGAVMERNSILQSIWRSVETSRWMYPLSMWYPILLFILCLATMWAWSRTGDLEWIGLIGIVGNAYTSSVLVTASLVYYQDKHRWIREMRVLIQKVARNGVPLRPIS